MSHNVIDGIGDSRGLHHYIAPIYIQSLNFFDCCPEDRFPTTFYGNVKIRISAIGLFTCDEVTQMAH